MLTSSDPCSLVSRFDDTPAAVCSAGLATVDVVSASAGSANPSWLRLRSPEPSVLTAEFLCSILASASADCCPSWRATVSSESTILGPSAAAGALMVVLSVLAAFCAAMTMLAKKPPDAVLAPVASVPSAVDGRPSGSGVAGGRLATESLLGMILVESARERRCEFSTCFWEAAEGGGGNGNGEAAFERVGKIASDFRAAGESRSLDVASGRVSINDGDS